ncbi:hypothetical protein Tco_0511952, partial [Tanacetum coccineum]
MVGEWGGLCDGGCGDDDWGGRWRSDVGCGGRRLGMWGSGAEWFKGIEIRVETNGPFNGIGELEVWVAKEGGNGVMGCRLEIGEVK